MHTWHSRFCSFDFVRTGVDVKKVWCRSHVSLHTADYIHTQVRSSGANLCILLFQKESHGIFA